MHVENLSSDNEDHTNQNLNDPILNLFEEEKAPGLQLKRNTNQDTSPYTADELHLPPIYRNFQNPFPLKPTKLNFGTKAKKVIPVDVPEERIEEPAKFLERKITESKGNNPKFEFDKFKNLRMRGSLFGAPETDMIKSFHDEARQIDRYGVVLLILSSSHL